MQWQDIENQWNVYQHKAKKRWIGLSDTELYAIGGNFDRLIDCIQLSYGIPRNAAEEEVRAWADTFGGYDHLRGEEPLRPRVSNPGIGKSGKAIRSFGPFGNSQKPPTPA